MKYSAKLSRRLAAWVLTLAMLLTGFAMPAYAQADWELLSIRLSWLDANGNAYESYAAPVSWSEDQSYWAQVNADAPLQALTMNISHPNHAYVFDPADGSTLMNVVDAGTAMDTMNTIVINAYENDAWATAFNLYISTQINMPSEPTAVPTEEPTPEPTEAPTPEPAQANVTIVYRSNDGSLYQEETRTLTEGGDNTIYAPSFDGYTLASADSVYVDVSANGANPAVVEFIYDRNLAQANVTIVYRSNDGSLYQEETRTLTEGGDNTIYAPSFDGYTLASADSVYVDVSASGANPAVVEFVYDRNLAQANVTIVYRSNDGSLYQEETRTLTEGGDNTIYAPSFDGYTLASAESVYVDVSANGANPAVVEFVYDRNLDQANVTIVYRSNDGSLYQEETRTLTEGGDNTIYAPSFDGYTLASAESVYVDVSASGANPAVVEFIYDMDVQPTEAPTEEPTAEPTEAPTEEPTAEPTEAPTEEPTAEPTEAPTEEPTAEPTEAPTEEPTEAPTEEPTAEPTEAPTEEPTAEPTEAPTEEPTEEPTAEPQPAVVTVYYRNAAGENILPPNSVKIAPDTTVQIAPEPASVPEGYDPASAVPVTVKVSAQGVAEPAEVVFTFAEEEPAETPIPQGNMINRFGKITKKQTNVRTGPGKGFKSVKQLAKGTAVYMLRVELNEDNAPWARVLIDGETYYISADCIEAMSQKDSDAWMADEMATPVPPFTAEQLDNPQVEDPTQAPTDAPTDAPTEAPTEAPTQAPTEAPTNVPTEVPTAAPSEVPAIYQGYALTNASVGIRSQVAGGDATIVRLVGERELVMVTGQEFHNGNTTWSAVTTLDGVNGYVPDSSLRHINNEEAQFYLDQWADAHATPTPTAAPTDTPAPTAEPAQYTGYALTQQAVALRTEVSTADATIITRLDANQLVMLTGQTFHGGQSWSLATTLDNVTGYLPDSSLRRINNEEAQYYKNLWEQEHPTPTPTAATPSPEPIQITGYAYTIGDDVYFRHQATTMASIIDVLPKGVIVYVRDQDYPNGEAWHVVQYNSQWGYIRADMLRMMTVDEENAYLASLATPEPTPVATPQPYNPGALSSYGYVSDSSVNFRKEANTSSSRIRQLRQYAFCLVLGTREVDGVTWYHITYGGDEGYVHGKYFKQMSMAELEEFLDSEEYRKGIANNANAGNTNQDNTTGGGIISAEDQTVDQWTNPNNGLHVSYEPFDPFATVAPVATPVATATATITIPAQPTATLEPIPTMEITYPNGNEEKGSSGVIGWVIAVVLIALIGGGVYAYVTYVNNKRKAAQRAAARRAQAAAQQRNMESRPYARTAPRANQPRTGTYPNQNVQRPAAEEQPQVRRPYTGQTQNPESYARPVQSQQPQQTDYTASYRNPNAADAPRPMGRRSAYRAQKAQQNGYTASFRSEESTDFKQDENNGDFE